jgi:hypothetical protein
VKTSTKTIAFQFSFPIRLEGVEEHSPNVYELDTTDLSSWQVNVEQRAEAIIDAFLKVILV